MKNKVDRFVAAGVRVAVLVSLMWCSSLVLADEPPATIPGVEFKSIWVNAGMLSYHFDRSKDFQEHNHGFGIEADFSDENALFAGNFVNSVDHHSNYLGWAWRPKSFGPARVGVVVGMFDGYPRMNNGGWFPVLLPVATFEYGFVGLNVLFIPKVQDKVESAAVFQFKLRLK